MFDETFSFDAPASPSCNSSDPSYTRDTSRSVSPCTSPTKSMPRPPFSVTDLTFQLSNARLHQRAQICYDSCEAYASTDDDAGWTVDPPMDTAMTSSFANPSSTRQRPARAHSPTQRTRRQTHARLLCASSAHHREIAMLVARMVDRGDQCAVSPPSPPLPPPPPSAGVEAEEDEGYDSSELMILSPVPSSRRRSSMIATAAMGSRGAGNRRPSSKDSNKGGACVSKSVRVRKGRNSASGPSSWRMA